MSGLLNIFAGFSLTDWISFVVGLLMCLAPVLQIKAIWDAKDSANVPMGVYAVFLIGSIVWFQSALSAGATPIAFSEVVGIISNGACLVCIHRYRERGRSHIVAIEQPTGQERIAYGAAIASGEVGR